MTMSKMKVFCNCNKQPGPFLGTAADPAWFLEQNGEEVFLHYVCAPQGIKDELGCPCECHREIGEQCAEVLMMWCVLCPVDHKQAGGKGS